MSYSPQSREYREALARAEAAAGVHPQPDNHDPFEYATRDLKHMLMAEERKKAKEHNEQPYGVRSYSDIDPPANYIKDAEARQPVTQHQFREFQNEVRTMFKQLLEQRTET
jgi:hypothetical protein